MAGDDSTQTKEKAPISPPVGGPERDAAGKAIAEKGRIFEERDDEARQEVSRGIAAIGDEAKHTEQVEVPSDLGGFIKSPDKDARQVIAQGNTIEVPISEEDFIRGQETKFEPTAVINKEVIGVKSIIGLVTFVRRVIKQAPMKAKNIIFSNKKPQSGEPKLGEEKPNAN